MNLQKPEIIIEDIEVNAPSNSSRFFENRACQYYPCHKNIDSLNCLFCFCPFYSRHICPGSPAYKEINGQLVKVCSDCIFPHISDNYESMMKMLSNEEVNS